MKLYLKAHIVQSNKIKKTAANPNIIPGKKVIYKNYYEFKVIGISSDQEGWIMEAGPTNFYKKDKDRHGHLVRPVSKKEYFLCKFDKKFPWNNKNRYFQFDFDHPIYDSFETKKEKKFIPFPFVKKEPLPKAKHLFTKPNGQLMNDQNLTKWSREGEKFVQQVQKLIDDKYAKNKFYPYPVNELTASRLTINPIFKTTEYREEKDIPKILKPSAVLWKNQLKGINEVFILWSWAFNTIEGMLFNEMILPEEAKKAKKLIHKKFDLTKKMKNIFTNLQVPEQQ